MNQKDNKPVNLDNLRHSCSHLLAAAVMKLWPDTKRTIGPAIENGFYYDFEFSKPISDADFPKIEKKMHELVPTWKNFQRFELTLQEAKAEYPDNPYKHELIDDFDGKGEKLIFYKSGEYWDLCQGGHIDNPYKELKYFKLLSVAGAYWRGDEKNKMLTRIYGTCFPTKVELDKFLWQKEEAVKRDHRLLGKSLDLFIISNDIGLGLPLLTPKGTIIRNEILNFEYKLGQEYDFEYVTTPHIAKIDMYKKTGHWQHYRDVMYSPFGIEGEKYVLKPMNCPHHYMIYQSSQKSYRDLPKRYAEAGTCYRFEKTGELSGLLRVRALTIDDAHILMREDQIEEEFSRCIEMVKKTFQAFNLNDYYVRLSLPDPSNSIKYIAENDIWNKACQKLEEIVKANKLKYVVAKGEASFYGPKIDYMVKDSIGREWQMSTLQLDLFMGKRLNLTYNDKDGLEKHPVILHRGLTGSVERTLAVLIEHFAGAFPLWLAPVQIVLIPISDRHLGHALKIDKILRSHSIRCQIDSRSQPMQSKIRDATLQKVPFMGIIGDKEMEKSNQENLYLSVRERNNKNNNQIILKNFLDILKEKIEKKF